MKTFHSDTHRAELSKDAILNVYALEGRKIKELSFNGDDVRVKEHTAKDGAPTLRNLLDVMDNCPVFRAAFAQNDIFYVDYEAGTQRWKGYKPTDEVREALNKCKFAAEDIDSIIDVCSQVHHSFLPKVG